MARTPEGRIQNAAIKEARRLGIGVIRLALQPSVGKGWPDVIFLIPGGRPLFAEFKRPGGKPTDMQRYRIGLLEELGYDVCIIDDENKAYRALASRVGTPHVPGPGG